MTTIAVSESVRVNAPILRRLRDGQPPESLRALARDVGRDPGNMSRTHKVLEKEGLVAGLALTAGGAAALAALDAEAGAPGPAPSGGEIPLALIDRDPDLNPRKVFNQEELAALAASIKDKGVIQPVLLRYSADRSEGRYRLVAGERRYRASLLAGVETINAVVRDLTDGQAVEIALIENIQRVDLSPIEEARAFRAIIEAKQKADPRLSQRAAADAIVEATRKSLRYIEQRLQLLKLPAEAQERMALPADHPRHLSVTGARDAMQEHDRRDAEIAEISLTPAQLLMVAEIAVMVAGEGKMKAGLTRNIDGAVLDDQAAVKALVRKGMIFQYQNYTSGFQTVQITDKGLRLVRLRVGKIDNDRTLALRLLAQTVLGADAFAAWDERGQAFTTPWLNEPHNLHPAEVARRERLAEEQRQQAEAAARRAADQARIDRDNGAWGREILAAVRAFEKAAPRLDHAAFAEAFSALLTAYEIPAPFLIAPDPRRDNEGILVDGHGAHYAAAGPALEARRRLLVIAMNHAAGAEPFSGDPIPGGLEEAEEDEDDDPQQPCSHCGEEHPVTVLNDDGTCPACGDELDDEPASGPGGEPDHYATALALVLDEKKPSTSFIQRRLQLNYNTAAALLERMEQAGVVSAPDRAGRRQILAQFEEVR